jgi:hypothetical protein
MFCGSGSIGLAVLSQFTGITADPLRRAQRRIYREQEPDAFRKAVAVHIVWGLLLIAGWFVHHHWHVF